LAITNTTGAPHTATPSDVTGALGYTPLNPENNLSEFASNPLAARGSLGLGSISTANTEDYLADSGGPGLVFRSTTEGQTRIASNTDLTNVLGFTPENSANKGAQNGYAPLDSNQQLPLANLTPQIPFSYLTSVPTFVLQSTVNAPNGIPSLDSSALIPTAEIEPYPPATVAALGPVRPDGNTILVDNNGIIDVNSSLYQPALGFTPENAANKGLVNGYAALNNVGQLLAGEIPPIPFTGVTGVPNFVLQSAVGQPGGIAPLGSDGTVSFNFLPQQPAATPTSLGVVKPDNTTINVDSGGRLTVNSALYDAVGTAANAVAAIPTSSPTQTHPALISPSDWATFNAKANPLGYTAENLANKAQPNGYASLDASGNLVQPAVIVQLAGMTLPGCDGSTRGKLAFAPGSGSNTDQFFGCMNTGANVYSWLPLTGGSGGGGGTTTTPLENFSSTNNVSWTHGLAGTNLVAAVWDASGSPLRFSTFQLTDANNAAVSFAVPQSGAVRVALSAYNQSFTAATNVTVTHNLGSLNVIPVVYNSLNQIIEPSTFTLSDANNAVMTFATPQTGIIRFFPVTGAYQQTFGASNGLTVNHNLNSTQLAVAVYDTGNNLIQYQTFTPSDANNAVLTFASSQAGRVVVFKP
jgi:hypothetical protein